jgi:RNA polymerase sigma factor (sigma-70 family)
MIDDPTTEDCSSDSWAIEESLRTPASFARVFERHFGPVHHYISQRLGPDQADELGAETFLVAFDRRSHYDLARLDARPWLLGIATNLVHRHWRAERRWLKVCERLAGGLSEGRGEMGVAPGSPWLNQDLALSLRSLARRDREALLLLAWAELSYEEIAVALAIPVGTVRSRINRARRKMRESMGLAPTQMPKPGVTASMVAKNKGDFVE